MHGAQASISDKDEAAGSSPARPTKWLLTSGDANYFSLGFRWARMHPIRDEVCRVRGLRACVARLPSTFAGRLPFTMVACSAAQRSETAYLRVPVQRHDGWRLIPEVTDRHHRGQGRVTVRSCQVAVDALEEVRAAVLRGDVGPGD